MGNTNETKKVQTLQNFSAKVAVGGRPRSDQASPILEDFEWPTKPIRAEKGGAADPGDRLRHLTGGSPCPTPHYHAGPPLTPTPANSLLNSSTTHGT